MTKKILKKRQKKLLKAEVEKIAESLQEGVTKEEIVKILEKVASGEITEEEAMALLKKKTKLSEEGIKKLVAKNQNRSKKKLMNLPKNWQMLPQMRWQKFYKKLEEFQKLTSWPLLKRKKK